MHDSLKINEELQVSNGILKLNNHTSGKLVGSVTIDEMDSLGNILFTETAHNDITLPGSIFILEQMFKKKSAHSRFLVSGYEFDNSDDEDISDEQIFGFVVGTGGESASAIEVPAYESSDFNNGFIPLRMETASSNADMSNYYLSYTDNDGNTVYYAKGFNAEPTINVKRASDGSDVTSTDNLEDVPLLTYAEVRMTIDARDTRKYFESNNQRGFIDQLGLVAGKAVRNNENTIIGYKDVKLVTILNFKSKDLSNDENTVTFTYKIYCM